MLDRIPPANVRLALTFAAFKGTALASVTAGLGIDFFKAMIIGVVSAAIGSVGTVVGSILAARIASQEAIKTRAVVHDVKRKLGADNRATDQLEPPQQRRP